MIRRVFALLGGGAALLTFASCSTFDTDTAATVNGTDITVDDLQSVRARLQGGDRVRGKLWIPAWEKAGMIERLAGPGWPPRPGAVGEP